MGVADSVEDVAQRLLEIAAEKLNLASLHGSARRLLVRQVVSDYSKDEERYARAGPPKIVAEALARLQREDELSTGGTIEPKKVSAQKGETSRQPSQPVPDSDDVAEAHLPGLEEAARQRRIALVAQFEANREVLTQKLREYLPTVEGCSFPTVEASRAFVSELNLMLENAGQRLVDPETGRRCSLAVIQPPGAPPGGYFQFRLDPVAPGKKRGSSRTYKVVPTLLVLP